MELTFTETGKIEKKQIWWGRGVLINGFRHGKVPFKHPCEDRCRQLDICIWGGCGGCHHIHDI